MANEEEDLLKTGRGADVFFLVGKPGEDDEFIFAHMGVLSAISAVFKAQFSKITSAQKTKEKTSRSSSEEIEEDGTLMNPIKVPHIRPDAFRAMLRFIYSGGADLNGVNKQNALNVYYLGQKYKIAALVEKCRKFLMSDQNVNEANAFTVRKFAQHFWDNALIRHCWTVEANHLDMHNFVSKYLRANLDDQSFTQQILDFAKEKNAKLLMDSEDYSLLEFPRFGMDKDNVSSGRDIQELKEYLLDKTEKDMHFLVGNGEEKQELISAHQFILFDIFNVRLNEISWDIWTNNNSDKDGNGKLKGTTKHEPIKLSDVHLDVFHALIKSIYDDDKQFSGVHKQNVLDCYSAGRKFEIAALVKKCRQLLMDAKQNLLGVDNAFAVLTLAKQHGDYELIQHCATFVQKNMVMDVHFLVGKEGEQKEPIPSHKCMLSAVSPVFEGQFSRFNESTSTREGSNAENPIVVPDISPEAFCAMLRYIYLNDLDDVNKQNVMDVYNAGVKYMITDLVNACRDWLLADSGWKYDSKNLGVDNVLSVLKHALFHEDEKLISHCWRIVDNNANKVLRYEEFFDAFNKADLCELLGRDTLIVYHEMFLFDILQRWAVHKCETNGLEKTAENKRKAVGDAIYQIRFLQITRQQFTGIIAPSGLLTNEDVLALNTHYDNCIGDVEAKTKFPYPFNSKPRLSKAPGTAGIGNDYYKIFQ